MVERGESLALTFPEFKALVRLLASEAAACLPSSVPLSVDDLLMDRVEGIAEEAWFAMKGRHP